MPPILESLLGPLRWLIETALVADHALLGALGAAPDAGLTWVLAILILLVLVRVAMLPLVLFATTNAQKMVVLTDALVDIRARYAGRNDAESRQRKADDIRAARQATTAKQVTSAVPQLIQVPIFAALYAVLRAAETGRPSAGPLTRGLARSFARSAIDGVPLRASLFDNHGQPGVIAVALSLTLVVALAQFSSQALSLRFNITEQATRSPLWRFRPTPLFVAPPLIVATSLAVPLGLLFYLTASSVWTLGQQGFLLSRYPLPTTRAHHARQRRIETKDATGSNPGRRHA